MKTSFSLRHRLTLSIIAILVAVASIYFFFNKEFYLTNTQHLVQHIQSDTEISLKKQLRRRGEALGTVLTENLFDLLYTYNVESTYEMLKPVLALEEVNKLHVIDENGELFHDGSETLWHFGADLDNPEIINFTMTNNQIFLEELDDTLIMCFPISESGVVIGALYMVLSLEIINRDMTAEFESVEELRALDQQKFVSLQFWLTICILVVGIIIAWAWAGEITRPLKKLINHLNHFGSENFNPLKIKARTDEIGELANSFNEMGGKINRRTDAIKYMAYHDSLTNLPNRLKFTEHVEDALQQPDVKSMHLFFIDLDEFKSINDTHGHAVGDEMLVIVSERLKALVEHHIALSSHHLSQQYNLVSRIGGDEFLICIVNASHHHIEGMGNAILKCLQRPIALANEERIAGGSIGISSYPVYSDHADELIKQSDMAMYSAKEQGRNTYCEFNMEMKKLADHKSKMEVELRKSLDQLDQFELWYQPKIELKSHKIVGAEALVRWKHPQRGYIFPNDFIEIAESSDIILNIGEALIKQLAETLRLWKDADLINDEFHVAINLSARQIYRQDLHGIFQSCLKKYKLSPSIIQVEVTESLLIADERKADQVLTQIQDLGIDVWLDDFGTGYSSLSYLQNLSFNGVKVDRSFIQNIDTNTKNQKLVHAVISLANSLELDTVAEGIETQKEVDVAIALGCHIGQGYFFAKPMPAKELESNWLSK